MFGNSKNQVVFVKADMFSVRLTAISLEHTGILSCSGYLDSVKDAVNLERERRII